MPLPDAEHVVAAMRWLLAEKYDGNQSELAKAIGITPSAVGQHLSGKNRPSHENARVVARLCGTTVDVLRAGGWKPGAEPTTEPVAAVDPRIREFVRTGLATERAARALGPFAYGAAKRSDVELLTALRQAEDAIRLIAEPPDETDEVPMKRRKKR